MAHAPSFVPPGMRERSRSTEAGGQLNVSRSDYPAGRIVTEYWPPSGPGGIGKRIARLAAIAIAIAIASGLGLFAYPAIAVAAIGGGTPGASGGFTSRERRQ